MTGTPITPEKAEQALRLYTTTTLSQRQIAERLEVTTSTVSYTIRKLARKSASATQTTKG